MSGPRSGGPTARSLLLQLAVAELLIVAGTFLTLLLGASRGAALLALPAIALGVWLATTR